MIVTVARQLGSGGGQVGEMLASRLAYVVVDREILRRAAEKAGVDEATVEDVAERRPSILELMSTSIVGYQIPLVPEYMPPDVFLPATPSRDAYRRLIEDVIRDVAARGDAVIVGRGAQVILKDVQPAVHVFVYAPMEARIRRVAERDGIPENEAKNRIKESDRNRSGYLKTYYNADWQDPGLYDLVLNTGRLSLEQAVEQVFAVVNLKGAAS
jgi:cytidylate kinase